MSNTKELMVEACENIGLDPTMCNEWSPSTLAAVQAEMGRILASKPYDDEILSNSARTIITSDVRGMK